LEALERLKAKNPVMVLTDLKLASLSGITLIKFILQNMKGISIIKMTAYPHLYPESMNGNEVEGSLVKPFDFNEMLPYVEKSLRGYISCPVLFIWI
jgi:DNA-binding NtrC family response regulator